MLHKHSFATALGFLALLGAVEVANARIYLTTFAGTRGQVAAACTGSNRILIEGTDTMGIGFSICYDRQLDTGVTCDDSGSCVGSYGDAPRGPKTKPGRGGPRDARLGPPPASLSEPVPSSPSESPAAPPKPADDVVIIIDHV